MVFIFLLWLLLAHLELPFPYVYLLSRLCLPIASLCLGLFVCSLSFSISTLLLQWPPLSQLQLTPNHRSHSSSQKLNVSISSPFRIQWPHLGTDSANTANQRPFLPPHIWLHNTEQVALAYLQDSRPCPTWFQPALQPALPTVPFYVLFSSDQMRLLCSPDVSKPPYPSDFVHTIFLTFSMVSSILLRPCLPNFCPNVRGDFLTFFVS